ncbi:MAG: spermidine synthase, partial [Micrococcus sp.]|nr:spermidine synthase [Micrococcus sp.]
MNDDAPDAAPRPRRVHLSTSGLDAEIRSDEHGGHVLEIGGAVQSHVDLAAPQEIRYEYLRRMASVLDAVGEAGAALRVLHLGAGALTLPRYVAVRRPGSEQVVVDLDRELVSFVLASLPLPAGARVESRVADAVDAVAACAEAGERFDTVVLDVGTGDPGAQHLRGSDFYAALLGLVEPGGALVVNIGDDDGLEVLGAEIVALDWAADEGELWTWAASDMLERLELGNAVLAVTLGGGAAGEGG